MATDSSDFSPDMANVEQITSWMPLFNHDLRADGRPFFKFDACIVGLA